jgi:FkbM family methyltransferase
MWENRVKETISCLDCNEIKKVPIAGKILEDKYQVMHNGIKVIRGGYHGDWMETIIRELKGHHEPQEEKAFDSVMNRINTQEPGVMIELGSNWAYYSMWFNKVVKDPINILLEPTEEKLELGKRNFKVNDMSGFFENVFIGRDSEEDSVFRDWDGRDYVLDKVCIDDIAIKYKLEDITILHSDIQGAEYDMLLGAERLLSNKQIEYLFVSTHGDGIHSNCLNYLLSKQYRVLCEHNVSESYSADGLIVVSRNDEEKIEVSKKGR